MKVFIEKKEEKKGKFKIKKKIKINWYCRLILQKPVRQSFLKKKEKQRNWDHTVSTILFSNH
jgi:hypothetical protein